MAADVLSNEELPPQVLCGLVADLLLKKQWRLATAESCTGGLVAAACTDLAGSSAWFECGVVSYSNSAKTELLGVDAALLAQHGAVSEAVARAMAAGLLARSSAQCSLAVTGIAGPGGGTPAQPLGTVWLAWATPQGVWAEGVHLEGPRAAVRAQAVQRALQGLWQRLQGVGELPA